MLESGTERLAKQIRQWSTPSCNIGMRIDAPRAKCLAQTHCYNHRNFSRGAPMNDPGQLKSRTRTHA